MNWSKHLRPYTSMWSRTSCWVWETCSPLWGKWLISRVTIERLLLSAALSAEATLRICWPLTLTVQDWTWTLSDASSPQTPARAWQASLNSSLSRAIMCPSLRGVLGVWGVKMTRVESWRQTGLCYYAARALSQWMRISSGVTAGLEENTWRCQTISLCTWKPWDPP